MSKKAKLHKKYKQIFRNLTRYYIVTGGRGSGKSYGITLMLCLMLYFEAGHIILFTRFTMASAHISIIPEFLSKIRLLGLESQFHITKDSITCLKTGSVILFRGIKTASGDQTANLKSISDVTVWVLDEAEELKDESTFDDIDLSIRSKSRPNKVFLILNPASKDHFIYKRFFEERGLVGGENIIKDNTTYIHTTYLDNIKNLEKSFIAKAEEMKQRNPKKYELKMLGSWLDKAEGVIFTNWRKGEFSKDLDYLYGSDFGFTNDPSTLVKVAVDKKNKKIYLKELLYKPYMTTSDLVSVMSRECSNKRIIADNSEPRLIKELQNSGLNVKACTKGAGSVLEGITLIQDYELIIDENSINLIKELNNYAWHDKKSGVPIDKWNHIIDAVRYAVTEEIHKPTITRYNVF